MYEVELPGLCRYHWGTDLDVYDRNVIMQGCHLKLAPNEVSRGGPFFVLDAWMEKHLAECNFFRPFHDDRGGVNPRWWQISYRPLAEKCLSHHKPEWGEKQIEASAIELKHEILDKLPTIFEKYFKNITIT